MCLIKGCSLLPIFAKGGHKREFNETKVSRLHWKTENINWMLLFMLQISAKALCKDEHSDVIKKSIDQKFSISIDSCEYFCLLTIAHKMLLWVLVYHSYQALPLQVKQKTSQIKLLWSFKPEW